MISFKTTVALLAALSLSACVQPGDVEVRQVPGQPAGVLFSGQVSRNVTPYDPVFECYARSLGGKRLSVAVGDIRDYTGKTSQNEGTAVTQGGALMAYTALGKLSPAVQLHERFDTRITDAELAYIAARHLGDGGEHQIDDATVEGGKRTVPWKPYMGGDVLQSDYYIVGGITELNYNIQSGGAQMAFDNVGPRSRTYVMNVAVDLRIVGTQTLKVYNTVSVQKQLVGYEVGVGLFRFFGNTLVDINAGAKNQEPLHLGVRMAIEDAVLQLVSELARKSPQPCLDQAAKQAATQKTN
jgi:curli biogenesis system outer membrane secretion channel CsgG